MVYGAWCHRNGLPGIIIVIDLCETDKYGYYNISMQCTLGWRPYILWIKTWNLNKWPRQLHNFLPWNKSEFVGWWHGQELDVIGSRIGRRERQIWILLQVKVLQDSSQSQEYTSTSQNLSNTGTLPNAKCHQSEKYMSNSLHEIFNIILDNLWTWLCYIVTYLTCNNI